MTPEEFRRAATKCGLACQVFERIDHFLYCRVWNRSDLRLITSYASSQRRTFRGHAQRCREADLRASPIGSPEFLRVLPCNNSGASILGDLLSSGLGVQGMLWATSPLVRSWKLTCSIGWCKCSIFHRSSIERYRSGVIQDTVRARRFARYWLRGSAP